MRMELEHVLTEEWFDEILLKNIHNKSLPYFLSTHKHLTIKILKKYPLYAWSWVDLTMHQNITMDDITTNPHLSWNYYYVTHNPNFTIDVILHNGNEHWNWIEISKHPKITMDIILQHPQLQWSYFCVLQNPNLTYEVAKLCLKKLQGHSYDAINDAVDIIATQSNIQQRLTKLLLFSIHEYHTTNPHTVSTSIEHILFDDYLLSHVAKY